MLLGVLDIGSNSAQLQVFEARPGAPPLPTRGKEPTLLGESFDPDGAIEPAGVDRVVDLILDRWRPKPTSYRSTSPARTRPG